MNVDKAYLLGLIIGGGVFGRDASSLSIRLPYKQWGSIERNPARAGQIARDILNVVKPMFKNTYGLDVSYGVASREWTVCCDGALQPLKTELMQYGIQCEGELRKTAGISKIVAGLVDDNMKRRFIAGLADTIGSTNQSHRRFSNDIQIISFEISGFQFQFVCDLCHLLHSVQCYPDQILWNHPNFHSGSSPYYKQWKKGFKLRVELDQYANFGAFAFRTKAESARENRLLQSQTNEARPCAERDMNVTSSCVHPDEQSPLLPDCIRGGHYLHNKHVCAVLGCKHAPYKQVGELLERAGEFVNPFPIFYKDTRQGIVTAVDAKPLYKDRAYTVSTIDVGHYYRLFREDNSALVFGNGNGAGYPINILVQAIAFLIAAENGELNGLRIRGSYKDVLMHYLAGNTRIHIELRKPDILTPLILLSGDYGVMVGANNPGVYSKLIERDPSNAYKIIVREIGEGDLIGAQTTE